MSKDNPCEGCGAKCCKTLSFTVQGISKMPDLVYYYETHGCVVVGDRIDVPMPCPQLDGEMCKLHGTDKLPKPCTDFIGQENEGYEIPEGCEMNVQWRKVNAK